jgi:hypothetical protein
LGNKIMAINTANRKGTNSSPAIFSPVTTTTKAAATTKNRAMGEVFSIMVLLRGWQ